MVIFFKSLTLPFQIIAGLLALTVVSVVAFAFVSFATGTNVGDALAPITKARRIGDDGIPAHYIRRTLDGVYVEPAEAALYPVAVMIDNDPLARPQAGLAHAQLVYEAKAEAGITRFMAVFVAATTTPEIIGSVRSARPYFIDWARGLHALYAHVGGSPEALEILSTIDLFNINEFYQGTYFWRGQDKAPPHNVYTATENLYTYLARLNATPKAFDAWQYKDEAVLEGRGSTHLSINYSVHDFLVEWRYDVEQNTYVRSMGGAPHTDADSTPIVAKNIVIMQVASEVIDEAFRRRMTTIGTGKAWYCLDGNCREGLWKKPESEVREKIYTQSGEEVAFNAGTTWIQVVQDERELRIENEE